MHGKYTQVPERHVVYYCLKGTFWVTIQGKLTWNFHNLHYQDLMIGVWEFSSMGTLLLLLSSAAQLRKQFSWCEVLGLIKLSLLWEACLKESVSKDEGTGLSKIIRCSLALSLAGEDGCDDSRLEVHDHRLPQVKLCLLEDTLSTENCQQ